MSDGKTSPFGNGQGSVNGSSSGGHDFVANPTSGGSGGGHDFVANPQGTPTGPKPTDFTKESGPAQQTGQPPDVCPQSIPSGGRLPFKGPSKPLESGGKPFKL